MSLRYRKRVLIIVLGDIFCFYFALFWALVLRYNFSLNNLEAIKRTYFLSFYHFSFIFLIWILLFTISRLYEVPYLINRKEFYFLAFKLFLLGSLFATVLFYLLTPNFVPKLVLVLTIIFSLIFLIIWRLVINWLLKERKRKVIIISQAEEKEELVCFINNHPPLGIELIGVFDKPDFLKIQSLIEKETKVKKIYLVVDEKNKEEIKTSLKNFQEKISYLLFDEFYETLTGKVALSLINEEWFNKYYFKKPKRTYEFFKRFFDILFGILLFVISLPIWPIIALLIKLDSYGPVLFKSIRVGKNEKKFLIYKFRTMINKASELGPAWTLENDSRITKVGKILRLTHLDEVPQVINIIKGETSFVGPRPEELKLVELFKKEIPYYEKRMLIKPGIIGWAQINYPHGASIKDAIEKLKYDFYYLKYRSLTFDFLIALKAWRIPFEIKTH